MVPRSMDARNEWRRLKSLLGFASAQTRFALGQVSYFEPGKISSNKTEKWAVFYGTPSFKNREERMRKALAVTTSIFGLMALQGFAARADEALDKLAKDPKQWVMQQGDDANTRYSKLNQINASNVKKLQVAWTFSTGVLRGHEGGPLVIGDVMYVHTPFPNTVYALDLNHEGKIIWKYEPRQDPNVIPIMCCDTVNRGVAYADGKIFLHQADTTLVALDAKTGAKVWSVMDGEA
jgi:glucose dehydrogenase